MVPPPRLRKSQIPIPSHARPIQFQPLHLKLRRRVLEIITRAGVFFAVQKPMHRVNIHADIDRIRLQPLSLRRSDQPIALSPPRMLAHPLLSLGQVSSNGNRIPISKSPIGLACHVSFTIEDRFDEGRHILRPKRSHRDREMKIIIKPRTFLFTRRLDRMAGRVFAIDQLRRDVHRPIRKTRIHGLDPSIDPSLARMNLLAPAHKAHDHSPVRMPVHARNQKLRLGLRKTRPLLLSLHEFRSLFEIPRPLCLVKDRDMFNRCPAIIQKVVPKVMHVLDKRFDTLTNLPLPRFNPATALSPNLITSQAPSRSTATSGPLPERNTACVGACSSRR